MVRVVHRYSTSTESRASARRYGKTWIGRADTGSAPGRNDVLMPVLSIGPIGPQGYAMFQKIARVMVLSLTAMVLPGVIVACSGGDASSTAGTGTGEVTTAIGCTNVSKHDDAQCKEGGSYALLDEINDETCSALSDAAELAKPGGLTLTLPKSTTKAAPATFSWGKKTAQLSPLQRVLDLLEPSASAHGRVDGDAYMLVFEDKGCTEVVRIFTKGTTWTADAASWKKLSAAAGPITLTVVRATLDNSAVKDGVDAVASKPGTFIIK